MGVVLGVEGDHPSRRRPLDEGCRSVMQRRGNFVGICLLGAAVATLLISPAAGQSTSDDWRCPTFLPANGIISASTPVIVTAAGCKTTFSVIAKMILAPDAEQVMLPFKPQGSTVTLETTSTVVADLTGIKQTEVLATFEWTPKLEDARAEDYILYFAGPDNLNCTVFKFIVQMEKCNYCVGARDSLHTIAADFNTHWTQIWSSNPSLVSPDYVSFGTKLLLGNFFRTRFGDTWNSIAARFGTTVDMIIKLNPDIDFTKVTGSDIPHGTKVCIMPETCPIRRKSVPGITW